MSVLRSMVDRNLDVIFTPYLSETKKKRKGEEFFSKQLILLGYCGRRARGGESRQTELYIIISSRLIWIKLKVEGVT